MKVMKVVERQIESLESSISACKEHDVVGQLHDRLTRYIELYVSLKERGYRVD